VKVCTLSRVARNLVLIHRPLKVVAGPIAQPEKEEKLSLERRHAGISMGVLLTLGLAIYFLIRTLQ
jgi:hypothetical protein